MASKTSLQTFGLILALAGIVFAAPFLWTVEDDDRAGLKVGEPLPPLAGTAWLNGKRPSLAELQGKVIVVDSWFPTCPKCHTEAPELVELHKKYAGWDDVVFIGLTHWTDEDSEAAVSKFIDKYGIQWRNAAGARDTLLAFKTEYFPSFWVFGRDGKVVWNKASSGALGDAIERAVATPAS